MSDITSIAWNVDEPTYRADNAYSYSTLSRFQREGFAQLDHLYDKISTPSLQFGSMVDSLLTDGIEDYDNRFIALDYGQVSSTIIDIVKYLRHMYKGIHFDELTDGCILTALDTYNWQRNWKEDTRIRVFKEKGEEYYNMLEVTEGKELVSCKDDLDARECVKLLKENSATGWYFQKDNPFDNIHRYKQLKFKGTYKEINLRCMADLIIVDDNAKTVLPCDLKTSSKPEYKFYESFINWNYCIQAQLYWYLIRQCMDKDPVFKDYKLLDYKFIVISRYTMFPLVWDFAGTICQGGLYTDKDGNNRHFPNWMELVEELDYYTKKSPKVPMGIKENEGNDILEALRRQ